ncbi:MAG: FCD domain-containing protein [Spongiibacteraceae bacterium]
MTKSSKAPIAIDEIDLSSHVAKKHQKVSQIVADDLRRKIAHGVYADGANLPPESHLITHYGVSRPTIREAVRILETEGLIVTSRGGPKGAKVQSFRSDQAARMAGLVLQVRGASILDVFKLRTIIEPIAAREVAERRPRPDFSRLEALLESIEAAADNPRKLTRLLQRFDELLMELSGNQALCLVSQMVNQILELHISTIPESVRGLPAPNAADIKKNQREFRRVVELLKEGKGEEVEKLMRQILKKIEGHHARLEAASSQLNII